MTSDYKVLTHDDIDDSIALENKFARDVFLGLSHECKYLSSKYLYDDKGSDLYEKIMDLPEYYLVRSEIEILNSYKKDIASLIDANTPFNLVELGSGNGLKTRIILEEFLQKNSLFEYIPIDISKFAMKGLVNSINSTYPGLKTYGVVADYFDAMKWLQIHKAKRNFVFFLGSNIGNFLYESAVEFLYTLWDILNDGDFVLIGFDLRKDLERMLAAYNDAQGVTSAFCLNLLERINRELGGNFNTNKFIHYEPYNVYTGAMTSYLISLEDQDVHIGKLKRNFHFKHWEAIHIEQSYKYTEKDIENLASTTGYKVINKFYDSNHNFCDSIWEVVK